MPTDPGQDDGFDFVGPTLHPASHDSGTGGVSPHEPHPQHPDHGPAKHQELYYPLWHPALASYHTGARFFGAPRPGRLHAACDLLAPYLSKIRAIADGVVIQPPYSFYEGTNALEVRHPGIGVVRYGEISSAKVIHWNAGAKVKAGELIAYVGRIDSTGASMIHFELYSGKASGPLTVFSNPPYQRRRDLVNPSSLVDRLYKLTF